MLDQIKGQETAVRYLGAVVAGRATRPQLLHGPEGTGKRMGALIATHLLFCTGDQTPGCGCVDCTQIRQGVHPDAHLVWATEKDIGVDAIRDILDALLTYPSQGTVRVVVIEGADRLTTAGANALLKTLEEPPPYVRFFLLAEDVERVLPTIRSRCGEVCFLPLPESFVLSVLSRHEPDATKALVVGRLSEGSVGRALQLWGGGRLVLRDRILDLLRAAARRDLRAAFSSVDGLDKEMDLALRFLDLLLHDLLMHPHCPDRCLNVDRLDAIRELVPQAPRGGWEAMRQAVAELKVQRRQTRIQTPFHLKSLIADLFVGV